MSTSHTSMYERFFIITPKWNNVGTHSNSLGSTQSISIGPRCYRLLSTINYIYKFPMQIDNTVTSILCLIELA